MLKKYKKDAYIDENIRMIEKNQQKNRFIYLCEEDDTELCERSP